MGTSFLRKTQPLQLGGLKLDEPKSKGSVEKTSTTTTLLDSRHAILSHYSNIDTSCQINIFVFKDYADFLWVPQRCAEATL